MTAADAVMAAGFGVSSGGRLEGREAPGGQGADERAIISLSHYSDIS
jgi:hypothetical protein